MADEQDALEQASQDNSSVVATKLERLATGLLHDPNRSALSLIAELRRQSASQRGSARRRFVRVAKR